MFPSDAPRRRKTKAVGSPRRVADHNGDKMHKAGIFKTLGILLPEFSVRLPKGQALRRNPINGPPGTPWLASAKPRNQKTKVSNKAGMCFRISKIEIWGTRYSQLIAGINAKSEIGNRRSASTGNALTRPLRGDPLTKTWCPIPCYRI